MKSPRPSEFSVVNSLLYLDKNFMLFIYFMVKETQLVRLGKIIASISGCINLLIRVLLV